MMVIFIIVVDVVVVQTSELGFEEGAEPFG